MEMLNTDLGYRAPLSNCPTRVNPEVKKAYSLRDSFNTPKKESEKCNTLNVAQLARELGIDNKSFNYRASKLIGKKNTNEMFDDEIMMVYNDLKIHKIRRSAKRKSK
jgi:hypothetical protein